MDESTLSSMPGLESADGRTDEEWLDWYQETFATELSLVHKSKVIKKNGAQPLPKATPSAKPKENGRGPPSLASPSSERTTARLRRRLKAVDAIEELSRIVELGNPVSTKSWEPDAPRCRGCHQDLGILNLKRRHHCRFCGLTFCHECAPGEIRCCRSCSAKRARFDAIRAIRALERELLSRTLLTRDDILGVVKSYRYAMDIFGEKPWDEKPFTERAKAILHEGLESFLDLDEIRVAFGK